MLAYFFLPAALAFLLTTLPNLFFIRSDCLRPVLVFSLEPEKTTDLMFTPLAISDVFLAFIAFIAFMAFIAAIFSRVKVGGTTQKRLEPDATDGDDDDDDEDDDDDDNLMMATTMMTMMTMMMVMMILMKMKMKMKRMLVMMAVRQ